MPAEVLSSIESDTVMTVTVWEEQGITSEAQPLSRKRNAEGQRIHYRNASRSVSRSLEPETRGSSAESTSIVLPEARCSSVEFTSLILTEVQPQIEESEPTEDVNTEDSDEEGEAGEATDTVTGLVADFFTDSILQDDTLLDDADGKQAEDLAASPEEAEAPRILDVPLEGLAETLMPKVLPKLYTTRSSTSPLKHIASPFRSTIRSPPTYIDDEATATINGLITLSPTDCVIAAQPLNSDNNTYLADDTDMLKDFLDRVRTSKAAKIARAEQSVFARASISPRRPLGDLDTNSPSSSPLKPTSSVAIPAEPESPSKRSASGSNAPEAENYRRSKRTRLPAFKDKDKAKETNFIPVVRRADGSEMLQAQLQKSAAQELSSLTRANTRRNKGNREVTMLQIRALAEDVPVVVIGLTGGEAEGEAKEKKGKGVRWDEQLVYFQDGQSKGKVRKKALPKPKKVSSAVVAPVEIIEKGQAKAVKVVKEKLETPTQKVRSSARVSPAKRESRLPLTAQAAGVGKVASTPAPKRRSRAAGYDGTNRRPEV